MHACLRAVNISSGGFPQPPESGARRLCTVGSPSPLVSLHGGARSLLTEGRELEMTGSFVLPKRKRVGDGGELNGAKEHDWRADGGADRFDVNVAWWGSS